MKYIPKYLKITYLLYFTAVSESSGAILLIKKKAVQGLIREHASNSKAGIGCTVKEGAIVLDRKTLCEVQTSLHICKREKAVCVFLNSNNPQDYFIKEVLRDESYFTEKVEKKILEFFDTFLSRKVVEDDTFIKC